jgi:hypothetical protein
MLFKGNEQLPVSSLQLFFATFFIVLSFLMSGSIFGYMAVLLRLMFKKANTEQERKDATAKLMEKVVLSKELRQEIARYDSQARAKL